MITDAGKDVGKSLLTAGGRINQYSHYGNSMEISQETKTITAIGPNSPTPGHIPKDL